jgi:hypothetical protein
MSHLRWTEADTQRARELLAADAGEKEFWAALRRTKDASAARVKYVDDPAYRQKCLKRARQYNQPYVSQRRAAPTVAGETFNPLPTLYGRSEPSPAVPPSKFEEANRRMNAPRSITAWICGDPAPGFSMLDQREHRP